MSQDTGKAVSPDQKDSPAKKAAAKAKEVSGDAQQKGEGKPDAMPKAKGGAKENLLLLDMFQKVKKVLQKWKMNRKNE